MQLLSVSCPRIYFLTSCIHIGEKMIVRIRNVEEFKKLLTNQYLRRQLNPQRYFVCSSTAGIALIPIVTSRHSHVYSITISSDKDFEEALKLLKDLGFNSPISCTALPEYS
jgi:hypothetical protein